MDGIGTRLATISGLRVYDYEADTIATPAAVVGLPESFSYDSTYQRGADRAVFPASVIVGKVSDRASRDALGAYLVSVKNALDGTLGGAADTARVMGARFDRVTYNGIDYLAVTFTVEVIK